MAKSQTPFTLRSGNSPLFKHVGSSPYKQTSFETKDKSDTNTKKKDDDSKYTRDVTVEGGDVKKGWQVGISALTGGLDAVYGIGKLRFNRPKITKDPEETVNTHAQNIIAGKDKKKEGGNGNGDYGEAKIKAEGMGHDLAELVKNQKSMDKNSQEWKDNQNIINEAYGVDKRH